MEVVNEYGPDSWPYPRFPLDYWSAGKAKTTRQVLLPWP